MRPRKAALRLPNDWLPGADWADRYEVLVLTERMTAPEAAWRALGERSPLGAKPSEFSKPYGAFGRSERDRGHEESRPGRHPASAQRRPPNDIWL
ncbi:protein of unknown function (plasmid) [Agrobacterium pusense]|uniref:Uncharacterized protein n=1 Tax=Agrobacterium pusense TaxID=648995 RepID=U4Q461_9HYPH|nr:protein of unknown function [Agrobacterium pusense]